MWSIVIIKICNYWRINHIKYLEIQITLSNHSTSILTKNLWKTRKTVFPKSQNIRNQLAVLNLNEGPLFTLLIVKKAWISWTQVKLWYKNKSNPCKKKQKLETRKTTEHPEKNKQYRKIKKATTTTITKKKKKKKKKVISNHHLNLQIRLLLLIRFKSF